MDEIEVRKINRISSRADSLPAAVAEDAEGLSSADVELAGTPPKRGARGVRGGKRANTRGWGRLLVRLLEVGLLAGLPGGMVVLLVVAGSII